MCFTKFQLNSTLVNHEEIDAENEIDAGNQNAADFEDITDEEYLPFADEDIEISDVDDLMPEQWRHVQNGPIKLWVKHVTQKMASTLHITRRQTVYGRSI